MEINIILIDDNVDHCSALKNALCTIGEEQHKKTVQITAFHNLEDGYSTLEKEAKFKAVILDAMCFKTRDQKAEDLEDFQFLTGALDELQDMNRRTGRLHIPFAVSTAYINEKSLSTLGSKIDRQKGKVFDKFSQQKEMLKYLLDEIEKSDTTKLENQFPDIFEIFDRKFLPESARVELYGILKDFEKPHENVPVLGRVRRLQDSIYKVLERQNSAIVPRGYSFTEKNIHLSGNRISRSNARKTPVYQTDALSFLATAIYRISSEFGSHPFPDPPRDVPVEYWEPPSNYAVQSLVFGLLEQLLWFKHVMKKEIH
jgi:hypothetical protein